MGNSTKYFLDNALQVISIELNAECTAIQTETWFNITKQKFSSYANWLPILHNCFQADERIDKLEASAMEKKIQAYLYEHIPIAKAMGIQVEQAARGKVVFRAFFCLTSTIRKRFLAAVCMPLRPLLAGACSILT